MECKEYIIFISQKKLLKFLGELVAFPWLSALLQLPVGDAL